MCSNAKDSGLLAKDLIVRRSPHSLKVVCFLTGNLKVSALGKDLFKPTAPATIKALCDYYNSFPRKEKKGALCVL